MPFEPILAPLITVKIKHNHAQGYSVLLSVLSDLSMDSYTYHLTEVHHSRKRWVPDLIFINEETEAQRLDVLCPGPCTKVSEGGSMPLASLTSLFSPRSQKSFCCCFCIFKQKEKDDWVPESAKGSSTHPISAGVVEYMPAWPTWKSWVERKGGVTRLSVMY